MKKTFPFILALLMAVASHANITNITTAVDTDSITVSWTSPSTFNGFVQFSADDSTCSLTQTVATVTSCGNTHMVSLTGLAETTTYCLRIGDYLCAGVSRETSGTFQVTTHDAYTPTETPTVTSTSTETDTKTATETATPTLSWTRSPTRTATPSITKTRTPTSTFTISQTFTMSPTRTATKTVSPTPSITKTYTQTATRTATPTRTMSFTVSPTATVTATATPTPTQIVVPTAAPTGVAGLLRTETAHFALSAASYNSGSLVRGFYLPHRIMAITGGSLYGNVSATPKALGLAVVGVNDTNVRSTAFQSTATVYISYVTPNIFQIAAPVAAVTFDSSPALDLTITYLTNY